MQKIKKFISILITLTIIVSLFVVPSASHAETGEVGVVVDADNASLSLTGSNNKNKVAADTTVVYEDSSSSIAWYNTGSGGSADSVDLSTIGLSDPTAHTKLTFRLYSDAADVINLLVYYTTTSGAAGKYVREPYTFSEAADNIGKWVDVTLDLTDIDGSKHTNLTTAATKLEKVSLNRGGWSISSTYNNNVYIDKIWFGETTSGGTEGGGTEGDGTEGGGTEDGGTEDDGTEEGVVVDADNELLTLTGSNNKNKVAADTTVVYEDSSSSIAWYNTGSGGSADSVDLSTIGLSDPTAHTKLTFRLYSDAADVINLLVYYTNTSGAAGKYVRESYTFSEEADNVGKWVDVTLDLTDIDGSKHTNLTTEATKLERVSLNRGGWSISSTYNNNVYIDKIWFSETTSGGTEGGGTEGGGTEGGGTEGDGTEGDGTEGGGTEGGGTEGDGTEGDGTEGGGTEGGGTEGGGTEGGGTEGDGTEGGGTEGGGTEGGGTEGGGTEGDGNEGSVTEDGVVVDADKTSLSLTGKDNKNKVAPDTTVVYEDSSSSIAWYNTGSGGSADSVSLDTIGLSDPKDSTKLTFRLYSNAADIINLLVYYTNTSGETGKYVREPYTFSEEAGNIGKWVEVTLDLTSIDTKNVNLMTAATKLEKVSLNRGSWSTASTYNNTVYIDKIWFELLPVPSEIEVADADKLLEKAEAFKANQEYKHLYEKTAEWNGSTVDINLDLGDQSLSKQDYFYLWVYSPEATGEEVKVRLVDSTNSAYIENSFNVDWTGWNLVEFSKNDFHGSDKVKNAATLRIMNSNTKLYFDRIWFSRKQHATIIGSDLFSNEGKLPQKDAKFNIKLSTGISCSAKDAIEIKADGNSFTEFDAVKNGNMITVTIPHLQKGVQYSVSTKEGLKDSFGAEFSDIKPIEFTVIESGSLAENIIFTEENGTVSAKSNVVVENGDKVTVILAAYENGSISGVVANSGTDEVATPGIPVTANTEIKSWVISDKYGILQQENLQEDSSQVLYQPGQNISKNFTLNNVYQDSKEVVLDMSYDGASRQAVAIVSDSAGNVILVDDFIISSDVQHIMNVEGIASAQDTYTVKVALIGDNKMYSKNTSYVGAQKETEILADVNASTSYNEVLVVMKNQKALFRVDETVDENTLVHIANVVYEQKTYNSFGDIHNIVTLAKSVLDELNKTEWSKIGDLFSKHSIILSDSEAYREYNQLNAGERSSLCKELVLYAPYNSFASIRNRIVDLAKAYRNSGTMGSGVKPSVSGNASGTNKEIWAQNPIESKDGFVDLNEYSWATESIYELLRKNVVTMSPDSKYRPGDFITKAEFVKLLVQAIGLNASERTACFNDINETDWYSPYFTAAKKSGIVLGGTDNNVNPNQPITRQDMAVMVKRSIEALGIDFKVAVENCRIADFSEVDTYAKDAVKMVMECGIMRGVGDDIYAPKESTNRASAAVVIAKLMKGIQSGGVIDVEEVESVATDVSQMQEYRLLNAIGVIADDDSILGSSAVTRREVARVAFNIVTAGDTIYDQSGETSFEDVKDGDADLAAITMMVSLGYMTENDGYFRPDDAITMYELSKVAVSLLGYNFIAEHTDGYPNGYMNAMSDLKLTKRVYLDASQDINNEEFINLIYNVLMASPAKLSGASDLSFAGYTVNSDNTLLYQNYGIYEMTGIFESDMFSDILAERPRASKGRVIISGEEFKYNQENVNNLVGHLTKAYINKDMEEAVAIFSYQTEEQLFSGRHVEIDSSKIQYETAAGKVKTEKYSKNVSLLYNGRQKAFDPELFNNINGTVTIIDNNRDSIVDVIKIYNYQTIQVKSVSELSKIIADGLSEKDIRLSLKNLEVDEEYLIYKNGKKATLKDIKVDDIISYTEVQSPTLITIYACDNTIKGTAEEFGEDTVTINGETYYLAPIAQNRIQLGTEFKFHLDSFGTVVSASTALDMVYGYLYKIYESDKVSMKIFTENDRWVELDLADKVMLDNRRKDAMDVLAYFGDDPLSYRQLIRYNVNDEAQIIRINTADEEYKPWSSAERAAMAKDQFRLSHREQKSIYYNTNKCFGSYMALSDKTKIFLVPPKSEDAGMEDFHIISTSVLVGNREYEDVASYNADETFVAGVVVIHDTVDKVFAIANESSVAPLMVITKINKGMNYLGEVCHRIVGAYNGSAKISFNTRDLNSVDVSNLEEGDIVQLGIDREGYIISVKERYDAKNSFEQYIPASSVYAKDAFMGGRIKSINPLTKRFVIQCETTDRGIAASFGANLKVYIYDAENNEVKLATTNDIAVGDWVFMGSRYLATQQMVIIR